MNIVINKLFFIINTIMVLILVASIFLSIYNLNHQFIKWPNNYSDTIGVSSQIITAIIALVVSVLQSVLTLMSAYAFSRLNFAFRKKYMKLILIIGMFPGFLGMIITFYILKYCWNDI